MAKVHETPSRVNVEDGVVLVDGPDGVAISLTPSAAAATSARLKEAAAEAGTAVATSTVPYAMIVDDTPVILMDACAIAEDAGFRVYDAGTGDQARTILEQNAENVTLLITDVEMPGDMDGYALARHVDQHWPWIEIVVASGQRTPGIGDLPAKATFIPKPFSAGMVRNHLRATLPDGKQPAPLKRAV